MEKEGLELLVECGPLPEPVVVDRAMWEKVVLNLLSNAYKHTFEGRITVRLESRSSGDTRRPRPTVADTGVGIPEGELPHLFERFHRVAETRAQNAGR